MDTSITISTPTPTISLFVEIGIISATFTPDSVSIGMAGSYSKINLQRDIWREIVGASAVYDDIQAARSAVSAGDESPNVEVPERAIPEISAPFGGGFFAGLDMDDKRYGIVVAPKAEGHFVDVDWKTAQERCAAVRSGGFDDWCAPTKDDSYVIYRRLGPNVTNAAAFKAGQPEAYDDRCYWTSTEYASGCAWGQNFGVGYLVLVDEGDVYRVRAVRKHLI